MRLSAQWSSKWHATHAASMAVLGALGGPHDAVRDVAAKAAAATRLSRNFAIQVETLRRWRNGGSQTVRVEHVHVTEGAQAIIGSSLSVVALNERCVRPEVSMIRILLMSVAALLRLIGSEHEERHRDHRQRLQRLITRASRCSDDSCRFDK